MPRRGRRRRSARVATTAAGDAAAGADRAARAPEIASNASDAGEGGRLAALFPQGRKLAIEFLVIAGLIALTAFLVYHFTTHTIANRRPLGGANTTLAQLSFDQTQMSFTRAGGTLFGASNDTGGEVLDVFTSTDGKEWQRTDGPAVGDGCAQGSPQVATLPGGGEVMAFLGAPECGKIQSLTPFLVVTTRNGTTGRWSRIDRVVPAAWKYGFDDGPALAASRKRLYLAWTRSLSKFDATTVVSSSTDRGKTWSSPVVVSKVLDHPHLVSAVAAPDGTLYVAGIDAKLGLWTSQSRDGGKTFAAPASVARLLGNPAATCAQTAQQPLPRELRACEGPDPTLLVARDRLLLVYSDFGANQTSDVFAVGLDPKTLKPLVRAQVNPPDEGKTQQFVPTAAVDAKTGAVWACWYDTTFDPHARRTWFTCAASQTGKTWSQPIAAASKPSASADVYGTIFTTGLRPSVFASDGVAHPFWADSRNYVDGEDVVTTEIAESRAFK